MSCLRQNKTLARFVTAVYKKLLGLFGYIEGIFYRLKQPDTFPLAVSYKPSKF